MISNLPISSLTRAEFTKYYVQPSLGESGVGGAMAVYGVFDAICSLAAVRFTSGLTSITLIVSGGVVLQGGILIWLLNYRVRLDHRTQCSDIQAGSMHATRIHAAH